MHMRYILMACPLSLNLCSLSLRPSLFQDASMRRGSFPADPRRGGPPPLDGRPARDGGAAAGGGGGGAGSPWSSSPSSSTSSAFSAGWDGDGMAEAAGVDVPPPSTFSRPAHVPVWPPAAGAGAAAGLQARPSEPSGLSPFGAAAAAVREVAVPPEPQVCLRLLYVM